MGNWIVTSSAKVPYPKLFTSCTENVTIRCYFTMKRGGWNPLILPPLRMGQSDITWLLTWCNKYTTSPMKYSFLKCLIWTYTTLYIQHQVYRKYGGQKNTSKKQPNKVNLSHSTGQQTGPFDISVLCRKQEGGNVLESLLKEI